MLKQVSNFCHRNFAAVVTLAAVLGYLLPTAFLWIGKLVVVPLLSTAGEIVLHRFPVDGIIIGLGLIMFGMGMTLSFTDFQESARNPLRIGLGVFLQFFCMPVAALVVVLISGVSGPAALGIILLGCCPGGTASNVIAFLADADVPLSVSITLTSTLLAPIVTPLLVWVFGQKMLGFYRGTIINVPVVLLMKTIAVIVVPLLFGLLVKRFSFRQKPSQSIETFFTL
ncbi:MAG: bile acid:sodium symporter family protein, partial [bacterium]